MESINGPSTGLKVETWAARTEGGYVGMLRLVDTEKQPDVVVHRSGVGPLPTEQAALLAAQQKAQETLLRRLMDSRLG